jgi:hypothetical protein
MATAVPPFGVVVTRWQKLLRGFDRAAVARC